MKHWRRRGPTLKGGGVDLGVIERRARVLLRALKELESEGLDYLTPVELTELTREKGISDPSNVIAWCEGEGYLIAQRCHDGWRWALSERGRRWICEPQDSGT